jgi:hypothetical protein
LTALPVPFVVAETADAELEAFAMEACRACPVPLVAASTAGEALAAFIRDPNTPGPVPAPWSVPKTAAPPPVVVANTAGLPFDALSISARTALFSP